MQEPINKAVLSRTLQHPVTLYSTTVGCLSGLVAALWGSPAAVYMAIGGLAVGTGSWIINYFYRGDVFAAQYVREVQRALEEHKQKVCETAIAQLSKYKEMRGAEDLVAQALEQFGKIQERYRMFQEMLADKLKPGELTYGKYLSAAEQVYLAVLDNLQDILPILESANGIDLDYIDERLAQLKCSPPLEKGGQGGFSDEIKTLEERKELRDDQLRNIGVLLTDNEEAISCRRLCPG